MSAGVLGEPDLPDLLTLREASGDAAILTSRQWPAKRRDIIGRLEGVVGALPQGAGPLRPSVRSQEETGAYLLQRVTYQVEPGEICPAWLLLPRPARHRQPAVLCCHQALPVGKDEPAGMTAGRGLALARELVGRGYVCLAPDCLTAGERVLRGAPPLSSAPYYQQHPEGNLLAKMLWDHQRALDFLCTLDAVDSDRLGVIGHGLGGTNAVLLAAFDHRVKVTAASCAYVPFAVDATPERWVDEAGLSLLPQLAPALQAQVHPPFTWVEVLALLAPRAFHYSHTLGAEDGAESTAVAADMLKLGRLYDLLGCRQKLGYHQEPGASRYPRPAREAAYRLLKSVLVEGRP